MERNREKIDFSAIEKKWQKRWDQKKIFEVSDKSKKEKFYVLEMFPYPSGRGLHMGHAWNYSIGDIYARYKIMQGFNVLHPMGFDSFGLPAENAAIKAKSHPKKFSEEAIKSYISEMKNLGLSYDWSRMFETHKPDYYKWDQWIFLKMFEKGLAYKKKAPVNYCSKCETVLANEQVVNGCCWRHEDTKVEIKNLEQWFLKTTAYAEELYHELDKMSGWPETIKNLQRNWIGRSEGAEILFEIPMSKETNFVLLHGFTATPEEDFHPWLKKELESGGFKVTVPELPKTNNPVVMDQVEYVLKNCKFDENTILLGHSLGSVVALKVLEKLKKPIKKLILAAGFIDPDFKDKHRPFEKSFNWKFDFEKIKKNVDNITLLRASNDTAVKFEQVERLKLAVGGNIIDIKAEDDHICGKSEPEVLKYCLNYWPIFTTRADTLFGVTFLVVSLQHPRLNELVVKEQKSKIQELLKKVKSTKEEDLDKLEKEGVFTGSYALHPLTKERIPIYAGNFVLADYGSGMVMAVPAHDQRDFEFAKKYKINMKHVIKSEDKDYSVEKDKAFTDYGVLINSNGFDGLTSDEAKEHIVVALKEKGLGKKTVNYRLKDWLISRQRFWGTPIPIIYCDKCGIVPVAEKDLPVILPENVKFTDVKNPLTKDKKFIEVKCPKCKSKARRETDTMDTFVNSSWYQLRYADPKNKKAIFDKKKVAYWNPVDMYIGGKEHACLHLMYIRFYTKFLRDIGMLNFSEPALNLFNQGFLLGSDGERMSKSKPETAVLPETVSDKYGIDTARLFLASLASPEKDIQWNENGIEGSLRFVRRLMEFSGKVKVSKSSEKLESKLNKTIKLVTSEIENFKYNLAVIKIRDLFESFEKENEINKKDYMDFLKLLSPFIPHVAEELWEKAGGKDFISIASWPRYDEKKINSKFEKIEEDIERTVYDVVNIIKILKEKQNKEAKKVYLYTLPQEKDHYKSNEISLRIGNVPVIIYAVNDKSKHDPAGKAAKAKPGRPAIYVE